MDSSEYVLKATFSKLSEEKLEALLKKFGELRDNEGIDFPHIKVEELSQEGTLKPVEATKLTGWSKYALFSSILG